ncbi:hypothetical protein [Micromonospora sp. RV43]|uniref:hypothetical protein n=1 Tax=Micromonospora sp. RV43 TaxID=1661387 RepID=UPI00069F404B|nr:hypothetical protein [Micromonospora sp. RV43]
MDGYADRVSQLAAFRKTELGGEPSQRSIARAMGVSAQSVKNWLDRAVKPQLIEHIVGLVHAIAAEARAQGKLDDRVTELLDEAGWRMAFLTENQVRAAGVSTARIAAAARASDRLGRPARQWAENPFGLGVHDAITVNGAVDLLPRYVPRPHDDALAAAVARAAAGETVIQVLVGDSSTGKTRACWEAVRTLGDDWHIWRPLDAGELTRSLSALGPRTVLWLDEIQRFLDEATALQLRAMIDDHVRRPLLLLGTIWSEKWERFNAPTSRDFDEPHFQARALLANAAIPVPPTFTGPALQTLRDLADADPRLRQAAERADRGAVTQYLAGVPEVLRRYQTATAGAQAVVHAAVDARRLGAQSDMCADFLATAALGELTGAQRDGLPTDWFERALTYLGTPVHGVRGPLTRADAGDGYVLADPLEQAGTAERATVLPPDSFWRAARAHLDARDVAALAGAARGRGLLREAAVLFRHAAGHRTDRAAVQLLSILDDVDPAGAAEAARWIVDEVPLSDLRHASELIRVFERLGLQELVGRVRHRAVLEGSLHDPSAVHTFLTDLREAGEEELLRVLLARDPAAHVTINRYTPPLLRQFRDLGEESQFRTLAVRLAGKGDRWLARDLVALGAGDLARGVLDAAIDRMDPADGFAVGALLGDVAEFGSTDQRERLLAADPAGRVDLGDLGNTGFLWRSLADSGATAQLDELAARLHRYGGDASAAWHSEARSIGVEIGRDAGWEAALPAPRLEAIIADLQAGLWLLPLCDDTVVTGVIERILADPALIADAKTFSILKQVLPHADIQAQLAANIPVDDPDLVAAVLEELADRRDDVAAQRLLSRNPATTVSLNDARGVARLLLAMAAFGRTDDILAREPWNVVAVDDVEAVVQLADALRDLERPDAAAVLDARVATEASLTEPSDVLRLLTELRRAGRDQALAILLARCPARIVDVHETKPGPPHVPRLLQALTRVGADEQVMTLAERAVAAVDLERPSAVEMLVSALNEAGAAAPLRSLLARLADTGHFTFYLRLESYLRLEPGTAARFRYGRDPDGNPSAPWSWADLA